MIKSPPQKPIKLGSSRIGDILKAIREGNKRRKVGLGRFTVFPYSASEARRPQRVPRVKQ